MDKFERTARSDGGQDILRAVEQFDRDEHMPIGNINFATFIELAQGDYLHANTGGVSLTIKGTAALVSR